MQEIASGSASVMREQPKPAPTFQSESAVLWVAFALPWLLLFQRLRYFWSTDEQYAYGWSVPALAFGLFYFRWKDRPSPEPPPRWLGSAVLILGMALFVPVRIAQEASPDWTAINWAFGCSVVGIAVASLYLRGGWSWAAWFAFPCLFALTAVPWPQQFEWWLVNNLRSAVTSIAVEVVNWMGIPAVQNGNVIKVPNGTVDITEACSGVSSIQTTFMVTLFFGELYRFAVARRAVLVACGMAVAVLGNLARTVFISAMAATKGMESAQGWHDTAGFAVLLAALAASWFLAQFFRPAPERPQKRQAPAAEAGGLLRLAAAFCTFFLLVEATSEIWYRSHERNARTWDWGVAWPTAAPAYSELEFANRTRRLLLCSDARGARWQGADKDRQDMLYWIRWDPGRTSTQLARKHGPEVCLKSIGAQQKETLGALTMQAGGLDFQFKAYTFDLYGTPLYVFYCLYEQNNADLHTAELKQNWTRWSKLQRALAGQRNQGQQSLEFILQGYPDLAAAAKQVERILPTLVKPVAE